MRNCIQFKVNGHWLRGVAHEPAGFSGSPQEGGTGVLLGNSGWLPRSGRGDLSVHLADAHARDGYWAFRFDMPGLGDSDGELPNDAAPLLNLIQTGGHGPCTLAIATELKKCYGLDKIILAGHCGSAMSAMYATLLDTSNVVSGLILMDMVFEAVPKEALADGAHKKPVSALAQRGKLRRWIVNAPGGAQLKAFYRGSIRAMEKVRGLDIPANSNTKLMEAWRRVMGKKLPTLVISAHHPAAPARFDYLQYLKIEQQPGLRAVVIEGTTHSFLEGNAAAVVQSHCQNWVRQQFPLKDCVPVHQA